MKLGDVAKQIEIDPRKLTEYVLNLDHPKGSDKAIMFQRHLGFTQENYIFLLEQITEQSLETEAILQNSDKHGQRYQVDLEIQGIEESQKEIVRTGWIVAPESNIAKLVTLYIKKRS